MDTPTHHVTDHRVETFTSAFGLSASRCERAPDMIPTRVAGQPPERRDTLVRQQGCARARGDAVAWNEAGFVAECLVIGGSVVWFVVSVLAM